MPLRQLGSHQREHIAEHAGEVQRRPAVRRLLSQSPDAPDNFTRPRGVPYDVHQRLVNRIQTLDDGDFYRPYREFQPESPSENPVINWVIGDTYDHYPTHQPWIAAIVEEAAARPWFAAIMLRELAAGAPHFDAHTFALMNDVFTAVRDIIEQGQRDGVFRHVDPLLTHLTIMPPIQHSLEGLLGAA